MPLRIQPEASCGLATYLPCDADEADVWAVYRDADEHLADFDAEADARLYVERAAAAATTLPLPF